MCSRVCLADSPSSRAVLLACLIGALSTPAPPLSWQPGSFTRNLNFVGTLPDVNTFRVSAKDLDRATNFVLVLPAFVAAVNESLRTGKALPKTSVIINVLYDEDFTAHGMDPTGIPDRTRPLAETVNLDAFGVGGLFSVPVRARACPLKCWMLFGVSDVFSLHFPRPPRSRSRRHPTTCFRTSSGTSPTRRRFG